MQPDYDCVVVGAGLVGAAQAVALSRLGLDVIVVDARAPLPNGPGADVRGLAMAPSSRCVFEQLGLWQRLEQRVMPVRHIHVSDQGRFGFTRLNASDADLDALGYVYPADHLMHTLEEALIEQCEVRWRTEVDGIETLPTAARVLVHGAAGGAEILARLVIGADGLDSRVRNAMGVATHTRDYRQSAIVANLTVQYPRHETAFERFTPQGPLALLPIATGRHVVVRCCADTAADNLMALGDTKFLCELEAGFGHRFGAFTELGKRTAHPLVLNWADRIVDHRVALVGAAANSIHPNGAQGLNLGLRDVASLASCLARAREAGDDIGGESTLAEFARSRKPDHRAVIRFTDGLAQLFSSKLLPLVALRDAAMLILEITPPAKRWLVRRGAGLFAEPTLAHRWVSDAKNAH